MEKVKKGIYKVIKPRDLIALIIVIAFAYIVVKSGVGKEIIVPLTSVIGFYFGSSKRSDEEK